MSSSNSLLTRYKHLNNNNTNEWYNGIGGGKHSSYMKVTGDCHPGHIAHVIGDKPWGPKICENPDINRDDNITRRPYKHKVHTSIPDINYLIKEKYIQKTKYDGLGFPNNL